MNEDFTLKLQIERETALFSKLENFNTIVLTKISLQCVSLLCYGNIHTKIKSL